MSKKSLGIDIGDSQITGVVLEQRGKSLVVAACLSLPLSDQLDPAQQASLLCQQLDWREGACVCGLPLSVLSVRNLSRCILSWIGRIQLLIVSFYKKLLGKLVVC